MALHRLILYDEANGKPYGEICGCEIGVDHDGDGNLMFSGDDE